MGGAAEKTYRAVGASVRSGIHTPATRITEQEIADSTGVSRTPVREALQSLQVEGFVTVTADQGAIVSDLASHDAGDVFQLRALLEAYDAGRACKHVGAEDLRALARSQHKESEKPGGGSIERTNSTFHHRIQSLAGRGRLAQLLPAVVEAPQCVATPGTAVTSCCGAPRTTSR